MIRFITKFKCKECGHTFIGADVEDNATAASMPVKCIFVKEIVFEWKRHGICKGETYVCNSTGR